MVMKNRKSIAMDLVSLKIFTSFVLWLEILLYPNALMGCREISDRALCCLLLIVPCVVYF